MDNPSIDFKQLFEATPGLYLILSPNLHIIAVNDSYNKATMTRREEILGRHLFDVFPDNPDDQSADGVSNLQSSLNYVLKHKKPHTMAVQKYDIRRPDGSFEVRYWSPLNTPLLDNNGEVSCIIHRVEDVTEFISMQEEHLKSKKITTGLQHKLGEMETEIIARSREIQNINAELENKLQLLKENEEKFQIAFRASPAGMTISKMSNLQYIDVNDSFTDMIGFDREELIGRTSAELGIVADVERREEVLKEFQEKGSVKNMEISMLNRSGEPVKLLCSIETITLNGENHMLSIIYDITERKKAEDQLASVNKELEAFSYSVSHDLRAPLRAINGYSEMLLEDYSAVLDEEAQRILGNIKHYAEKMGTLIDDLLTFSRLGRKELQKLKIDMDDLMEGVLIDLEKSMKHHADIRISKMHPVYADYGLIHQVMFNLVTNAVKYSSKREKPLVEISSEEKDNEILFTVKDNGAGFNMQYADKLFGVFQRLHSQEEFQGTGVGLAIVQRIISRHGGKIWAEAKPDEGATFYFSLPKNPTDG
ncbi:MAG: domain S-box protein [Crocinitomicaceae bacterium]|jgi:PAS domain S-box-containing protein|nr:domain S-box protein [Crocinitomicaceae bacterium]